MDLSVLIVNWNTAELLRGCLRSLRRALPHLPETEIVVVDNASEDGSAELVRREFPQVELIANEENLNYAAGSNQGLAAARGEFVLLLNPDTKVTATALNRLLEFLRERPPAAGVAPRLVLPSGETQPSVRGFPTPAALFGEVTRLGRLFPRSRWGNYRRPPGLGEPSRVDQPMASCLLLRREALEEIGGFDERFPLFFNDVDLCLRLRNAGWEIWYLPEAVVIHYGGASTRQLRTRAIWASHRALHRFLGKHTRKQLWLPAYAGIIAANYAAAVARLALCWLTGRARQPAPPPLPDPAPEPKESRP